MLFFFFFFNDTATTEIYTLSLHDALPICRCWSAPRLGLHRPDQHVGLVEPPAVVEQLPARPRPGAIRRSEEHTSELQSPCNLVCRLLLEKKKNNNTPNTSS